MARARMLILFLLVASVGCAPEEGPGPRAEGDELTPVRLILGTSPEGSEAPWYAAEELGIFEKHGIDVEVLPGETSALSISTVSSGGAEVGIADFLSLQVAYAADPDTPAKAFFLIQSQVPYTIFSMADGADIRTPDDAENAEIAIPSTSTLRDVFDAWARLNDVTDYRFANVDPAAANELLLAGEIESRVGYLTSRAATAAAAEEAGKELVSLWMGESGMEGMYGTTLFVNEGFAEENPDAVRGLYEASAEAYEYAFEHPTEVAEIMERRFPTNPADLTVERMRDVELLVTNGGEPEDLGGIHARQLTTTVEYFAEALDLPASIEAEHLVLDGYLK
jgi:NitT/TauT family transport system substrate-binding protein